MDFFNLMMVETENLLCETAHQIRIHARKHVVTQGLMDSEEQRGTKGLLDSKWASCMHAAVEERS